MNAVTKDAPPATQNQASSTALAKTTEKAIVHDAGLFHNFMDSARFEHLQRVANVFANSALVPEHFRGKAADCFIAVEMAMRLQLHPFNLMQSLYVVHGKPGIEAKMVIALINSSGIFDGPLQFKLAGEGMKRQCTAFAVHSKTKQVCETTVTMEMAKAEGWLEKSGSKWKTLPDLMLQYRSASFFGRLYCPEVIFGMQTREELEEIDVTPPTDQPNQPARSTLRAKLGVVDVDAAPAGTQPADAPPVQAAEKVSPEPPKTASTAAPEAAGGAQAPEATDKAAPGGNEPPPVPYEDILKYAKRAKTADQIAVVRDSIRNGYSTAQVEEVTAILNSKKVE